MFQLTHFIFLHKIKLDYGKKLSLIFMFYHNEGDKLQFDNKVSTFFWAWHRY